MHAQGPDDHDASVRPSLRRQPGPDAEAELSDLAGLPDRPIASSRQRNVRIAAYVMCALLVLPVLAGILVWILG